MATLTLVAIMMIVLLQVMVIKLGLSDHGDIDCDNGGAAAGTMTMPTVAVTKIEQIVTMRMAMMTVMDLMRNTMVMVVVTMVMTMMGLLVMTHVCTNTNMQTSNRQWCCIYNGHCKYSTCYDSVVASLHAKSLVRTKMSH